jgi:hypothetical protein
MTLTLLSPHSSNDFIRFKGKVSLARYHVIDFTGKIYLEGALIDNEVDITSLSSGNYFINVFSGHKLVKTFKVSKK